MPSRFLPLLLLLLLSGCLSPDFRDKSDAARRRQLTGHWYDRYNLDLAYAQGDTQYRANGTFVARYESVAPGASVNSPVQRETVQWSGRWKLENGALVEDIQKVSDPARAPKDRPMTRYIAELTREQLTLRNPSGNLNRYARKRPQPPKVTFTPTDDDAE